MSQFRDTASAAWRGPACSPRCRQERVVVVGGAGGRLGAQTREYHDHRDYEHQLAAQTRALASAVVLLASARPAPPPSTVVAGPLVVDLLADTVWISGAVVWLAPSEWRLLALLARSVGQGVALRELVADLWPDGRRPTGRSGRALLQDDLVPALRQTLLRLRRRLGSAGALIETRKGVSIRLRADPPGAR